MEQGKEVWVKGFYDKNGDILIHLGNDGYHRIIEDYVDDVMVKENDITDKFMNEIAPNRFPFFSEEEKAEMMSRLRTEIEKEKAKTTFEKANDLKRKLLAFRLECQSTTMTYSRFEKYFKEFEKKLFFMRTDSTALHLKRPLTLFQGFQDQVWHSFLTNADEESLILSVFLSKLGDSLMIIFYDGTSFWSESIEREE